LIAEGSAKLASVPSGGAGGAAPAAGASAGGAATEDAPVEEKEEGTFERSFINFGPELTPLQRRRSPMRIWVSVFLIKRPILLPYSELQYPKHESEGHVEEAVRALLVWCISKRRWFRNRITCLSAVSPLLLAR
jgi:hypothetical protein